MCLGIPGQVLEVDSQAAPMAAVMVSGVRRTVDLTLIEDEGVVPGDWVLVHAGLALSTLTEADAAETLALLHEMSTVYLTGAAPPSGT